MFKKLLGLAGASLVTAAIAMWGQAPAPKVDPQPAPKLEFEVASIKLAPQLTPALMQSGKMHIGMNIDGARVDIGGMPIASLLPQVFHVKQYQIAGAGTGTDFMNTERWDILAKLPEGATEDQVPDMLLALLVDRFKLAYHRENRERPIYALIVGKTGTKLKDTSSEADAPPPDNASAVVLNNGAGQVRISQDGGGRGGFGGGPGGRGGSMSISSPQFGTMKIQMGEDGAMHLEAAKITLAGLAELLTSFVDRPVLDMTEMKGAYQVTLDLSMQDLMAAAQATGAMGRGIGFGGPGGGAPGANVAVPTASDPSGGAIFQAVQKLGLKLDARKAPVETIVVDHLEKAPTEN
jgi:uncharacterized protein (TIGR03435 family)